MKRAILAGLILWLTCMSAPTWAAPNADLSATAPTQYEDGNVIPPSDVLTYTVYCGTTSGGGYPYVYTAPGLTTGGVVIDISTCVQGQPGEYFFVATTTSTDFNTESGWSNEASRIYTAADLGKVPNAPTLLIITG